MKKIIVTTATVLFIGLPVFAQDGTISKKWYTGEYTTDAGYSRDLSYEVHGRYSRSVKKEKLNKAKLIRDVVDGYPVNWIADYVSVEILATCNGISVNAVSKNEMLNTEQKHILNSVDLGTEIVINVMYKYKNPVTDYIDVHGMNVSMTVIPEIEAEYVGGQQKLKAYVKENIMDKIPESMAGQIQSTQVIFTINEEGKISNAKISGTTGNAATDKFIIDAINKMPRWKPAQRSNGKKVKQEFEFSIGKYGC